ncbi:MAG TPA: PilN domain-containing protein [Acidiferrobacterales bacterium]
MTKLNLLPWRDIRRKEQDRQLLSIGVGAGIMMLLVIFYAHLHVSALIENQQNRNKYMTDEIAKLEEQIKEIRELKRQRDALIARMRVIEQLQSDRTQIVHVFDDLVRKLPEGMYLTSLKQSGKNFTLTGMAQSNARVSALMRNLDTSDWFANPNLDVINVSAKGSDRVSQFTLRVTQKAKAADAAAEGAAP